MLLDSVNCIIHYFVEPAFSFLCLPLVFMPFIACDEVYGIDGKMNMHDSGFFGSVVNRIDYLAMVFLVNIIGHFSCDCINIQLVVKYEPFGFGR